MARTADPAGQREIPYHRMSCPVYKPGGLAGRGQSLLRDWLDIGHWVRIVLSITCIFPLDFIPFTLPLFSITIGAANIIITFYFIPIIKLFLTHEFYFFQILFFILMKAQSRRWASGHEGPNCCLRINHDTLAQLSVRTCSRTQEIMKPSVWLCK